MRLELINRCGDGCKGIFALDCLQGMYSPVERLHGLELIDGTFTGSLGYLQLDKEKPPDKSEGGYY